MLKKVDCLKLDSDNFIKLKDNIVEEVPLSIFVNGRHLVVAMISPQMIKEFVLGYLFSEKIIKDIKEIESLQIDGNYAKVLIDNPIKVFTAKKIILSGCGGELSFLNELKLAKIQSNLKIDISDIFSAIKFLLNSDLHKATGGVHIVGLFQKKVAICIAEDIGRHNALDKVIGFGLLKNINLKGTFIACTGRISSEMALKCSVANIPIIISKGAVTNLMIEIAHRAGLTTIGFVRGKRMNIYTHEERICRIDTQGRQYCLISEKKDRKNYLKAK